MSDNRYENFARQARDALIRTLKTIEFKNPPFPCRLTWEQVDLDHMRLTLTVEVNERDTGRQVQVVHTKDIEFYSLDSREHVFSIACWAQDVFVHEFRECFWVGGERFQDPHDVDKSYMDMVAEREREKQA